MGKDEQKLSKKQKKLRKQAQKGQEEKPQPSKGKSKQKEQESSESENADINLNHVEAEQNDNLEVFFLVGEINEKYYHSLKTILLRYGLINKITDAQLADAVIENKKIGNVVLADDDQDEEDDSLSEENQPGEDDEENVYSILTLLSGKKKITKKIRSIALKVAEKKGLGEEIIKILNSENTAVLLNERLSNLPPFVATSAHQVFKKDLLELKQKQRKVYDEYCSAYVLSISEIQYEGEDDLEKLIYSKFEDFQMCKRSKIWWLGQKNSSYKKKADLRNLYYLIKVQDYLKGVDNIKTYLQD